MLIERNRKTKENTLKTQSKKINFKTHKWIKAPFGGYLLVEKNFQECWADEEIVNGVKRMKLRGAHAIYVQ